MSKEDAYHLNIDKLKKDIKEQGLSVVCMSNPRNPSGQSVSGKELAELVQMGRDGTTMILELVNFPSQYFLLVLILFSSAFPSPSLLLTTHCFILINIHCLRYYLRFQQ